MISNNLSLSLEVSIQSLFSRLFIRFFVCHFPMSVIFSFKVYVTYYSSSYLFISIVKSISAHLLTSVFFLISYCLVSWISTQPHIRVYIINLLLITALSFCHCLDPEKSPCRYGTLNSFSQALITNCLILDFLNNLCPLIKTILSESSNQMHLKFSIYQLN